MAANEYRVIEVLPADEQRDSRIKIKALIFKDADAAKVKEAIHRYWDEPRKPWVELRIYQGKRRVYAYEL